MKVVLNEELIALMLVDQLECLDKVEGSEFKEVPFTEEMLKNYDEQELDMFPDPDDICVGCNSVCQASGLFYIATVTMDGVCPTTLDEYEFYGHVEGDKLVVDLASTGGVIIYGDEEDLIVNDDHTIYKDILTVHF